MKVNELMREAGVSRKAIYLYESKGLLNPIKQEENGYREYTQDDCIRLQKIALLRKMDIPLEIIAKILECPERTDILLQACLEEKKQQIESLCVKRNRLHQVVERMDPNGDLENFCQTAQNVVGNEKEGVLQAVYIQDYPAEYNRRILMNTFEAFLNVPADTLELKELWQAVLEFHKKRLTDELLEAYALFYGDFSQAELEEDFCLRRQYVCHFAKNAPGHIEALVLETKDSLTRLKKDRWLQTKWEKYYEGYACALRRSDQLFDSKQLVAMIKPFSTIYDDYEEGIQQIFVRICSEGSAVSQMLERQDFALQDAEALDYYLFFVHTYVKILESRKKK